jgi:glucose/arabinose dehydrogenase
MAVESLEARALLTSGPFTVVGPGVTPADFRVTTFASGLNYPTGLQPTADGSMMVAVSNPTAGHTSYFATTGEILRFTDANGDGVADGPGQVLYDGLPGQLTALKQAGPFVLATSSTPGTSTINVLAAGAGPASALSLLGQVSLTFPSTAWEHTSYALAVRPTPGQPGSYDVFFNVGSENNGIERDANNNVVLDSNGHAIPTPSVGTITAGGLLSGTLQPDSVDVATLSSHNGAPVFSNLRQVADGLRNAASLAIDPTTGDLLIADNGIDGNNTGAVAWSADTLDRVPAADIGTTVLNFGYPYHYTLAAQTPGGPGPRVDLGPTSGVTLPVLAFQPLPDANIPNFGSRSQGASGFTIAPPQFPDGLNHGVFAGFHGDFSTGGLTNTKNPVVFANPATGQYFDFVSNDQPNIGHVDGAAATTDALFLSDMTSTGDVFGTGGPGNGSVYEVKALVRDVSSQVTVHRGGFLFNRSTRQFTEFVTVTDTGPAIAGPIALVLDDLTPGVTLANASGTTAATTPSGQPFINLPLGNTGTLAAGQSVTVMLTFTDPGYHPIAYVSDLLAYGAGPI